MRIIFILITFLLLLTSCNLETEKPKPKKTKEITIKVLPNHRVEDIFHTYGMYYYTCRPLKKGEIPIKKYLIESTKSGKIRKKITFIETKTLPKS